MFNPQNLTATLEFLKTCPKIEALSFGQRIVVNFVLLGLTTQFRT